MIRLVMTAFTWKLWVCFVKDIRCRGRENHKNAHFFWIGTSQVYTHRTFGRCNLSSGNAHTHCNDRKKEHLGRLFMEVVTSCCPGFAGREGVKLDPLSNLKILFNHLAFRSVYNTHIWQPVSQNCTSKPWFRDTVMNQRPAMLFPVERDICFSYYWFGTQWPEPLMIYFPLVNNICVKKPTNNQVFSPAVLLLLKFVKTDFYECFQFAELPIGKKAHIQRVVF